MRAASSGLCVAISAASPVLAHEVQQHLEDPGRGLRVEVARRLVRQQQPRPVGERARERHPLLLAARELRRPVVQRGAEPHRREQLARPRLRRRPARARRPLRQRHVLQRRELRQQVVELVDEADRLAPEPGARARRRAARRLLPEQPHRAGGRRIEQPRDVQQRRLPRARRRHQRRPPRPSPSARLAPSSTFTAAGVPRIVDLADAREAERLTHSAAPRPGSAGRRCARGRA